MIRVYGVALCYIVILTAFTMYWGDHFKEYTHYKGEDFTTFLKILVGMNYLLLGLAATIYKKINIVFLILNPLLNVIIAFVLGLAFLLVSGISGIPKHTFYVFAPLFMIMSLISLFLYYRRFRTV